jgi:hypothetical protein
MGRLFRTTARKISIYLRVSLDNVLKVYNWDFPEWFDSRSYNTISEFIIAYFEQVLSIR